MSIKKLLIIGFVSFTLVLSGCFSTDSDDDDDIVIPNDSVTVQTALDSLDALAGTTEIDSSMKYIKNETTYTLTEKDTTKDDTIKFTATISGNTAALVMTIVEESESVTVTMNTAKVIGTGSSFDGTAWQLTSVKMANSDTFATYTLTSTEIQVFYLYNSTVYAVENGVSIDSIFEVLALEMMGVEPIDSSEAIDTLAVIAGTDGIDSSMSYVVDGDVIGIFETSDTTDLDIDISAGELTLTMDLEDGSTLEENFELFLGAGSLEGSIWQLTDLAASNSDTSVSYSLASDEIFLAYFYNGKFYIVEKGVDLYDDVLSKLFDDLKGYGNPAGTWGVVKYYSMNIDSGDTSYYGDSIQLDSTYNIFTISSTSYKSYNYDDMEIEVNEIFEDFTKGGTFSLSDNESLTFIEDNGTLTIIFIEDNTKYGYGYSRDEFICEKYTGLLPPNHWVTDTADTVVATPITVGGSELYGILDSSNDENWYSFTAEAGKYYAIETTPTDSSLATYFEIMIEYIESSTGLPVTVFEDGGETALFKASASIIYYIGISPYQANGGDYNIKIKELDIIATPTAAIGNWWVTSFIEEGDTNTFTNQDLTMMYTKVTTDSVTLWMNEGSGFNKMSTNAMFTSDNKLLFGDMEFSYATTDTTFRLYVTEGSDAGIDVLMSKYVGDIFPPAGVASRATKSEKIKLFK